MKFKYLWIIATLAFLSSCNYNQYQALSWQDPMVYVNQDFITGSRSDFNSFIGNAFVDGSGYKEDLERLTYETDNDGNATGAYYIKLITGGVPAKYGDETTGIVAIETYSGLSVNNSAKDDDRVIIQTASMNITVKDRDSANMAVLEIGKKYDGYLVLSSNTYTTIRVAADKFDQAMDEIQALGKVGHKRIEGKDVTEEYKDNQIRLENAEIARKRYLELLDRAENVEEALMVERELERLNGLIDLIKGRLQRLDHLAKFSTITVRFSEKRIYGPLGYAGLGIYHAVRVLFIIR
ncbi:MAG: DUF4349 domain-containing protein [Bacteroidetes bacterium]|nr:DUF4349 domain-containing protein [Bacteroidota bacterium]